MRAFSSGQMWNLRAASGGYSAEAVGADFALAGVTLVTGLTTLTGVLGVTTEAFGGAVLVGFGLTTGALTTSGSEVWELVGVGVGVGVTEGTGEGLAAVECNGELVVCGLGISAGRSRTTMVDSSTVVSRAPSAHPANVSDATSEPDTSHARPLA